MGHQIVTEQEGEETARLIQAMKYYEINVLDPTGVNEMFDSVYRYYILLETPGRRSARRSGGCRLQ